MTHRYSAVVAGSNRGTFSVSLSFRDNESQILCVCATNLVDLHYFIQRGLWSLISFFCRLIQMEGDEFLTDILLDGDHGGVAGGMKARFLAGG